jgi:hypothetical protein
VQTPADLKRAMNQTFGTEAVDPQWAGGQQAKFVDLFRRNKNLSGLALQDVECRSTHCRVTVRLSDMAQSAEVMQSMSRALTSNDLGIPLTSSLGAMDPDAGVANIYVARDIKGFSFPQAKEQ